MANWKKVIVSGSAAELASLQLDTALPVAQGGIGATSLTDKAVLISQDSGTDAVGSLALSSNGSLIIGGTSGPAVEAASDLAGSGLAATTGDGTLALSIGAGTGIDVAADAISVDVSDFMTNGSNNRIVTATGADAMNAEANLTFDGSGLSVTGHVSASGNMSGSASSTGSFGRLQTAGASEIGGNLTQKGGTFLIESSNIPTIKSLSGHPLVIDQRNPVAPTAIYNQLRFNSSFGAELRQFSTTLKLSNSTGNANYWKFEQNTLSTPDGVGNVSGSATSTGSFGFITGSKIQGTFLGDGNALDLSSNSTIGSNIFSTVAVSGQSNIVADSNSDTLTLAESTGLGITTNAGNDTVTFALDSAQTTIQTIFNTGLIVGRASGDTTIDFTADDVIVFDAGASEKMRVDTSGVDITGALTVSTNATIQGDLVVNGSTTTLSTTNLAVGDQFIFAATGSAGSNVDAGLVVQSGSAANTGSAFYHDINSQRWAVAKTVASNAVAVTPNQFVGTITLNSNPPSDSDGEYGVGEMWIETDTQDIFIRTG
tara:strand:+ start:5476 stop:7101 length:1626 start_codon:yes stop_codon:yes gene_type:complete